MITVGLYNVSHSPSPEIADVDARGDAIALAETVRVLGAHLAATGAAHASCP